MARRRLTPKGYRAKLREALLDNSLAVYHALMHSPADSLDEQLAVFLLDEAGWSIVEFLQAHTERQQRG
jgi:putative NIF3 family GTP cyclohydrolase 1 type 2